MNCHTSRIRFRGRAFRRSIISGSRRLGHWDSSAAVAGSDVSLGAARDGDGGEGAGCVSLGFGIVFAAMLLLTVAYSGWMVVGFDRGAIRNRARSSGGISWSSRGVLPWRCIPQQIAPDATKKFRMRRFLVFSLLLVIAVLSGIGSEERFTLQRHPGRELDLSRVSSDFYGLIFPGMSGCGMVGNGDRWARVCGGGGHPARWYWLAFANEEMLFAVPGVLVVVLAKIFSLDSQAQATAG